MSDFRAFSVASKAQKRRDALGTDQQKCARFLATLGSTRATFFYNFKWPGDQTFSAPTGFAAAFPAKAPFVRDFCIESNVGFGVSVVCVKPRWDVRRDLTPEIASTIRLRANKVLCEKSPFPPSPDDSPDSAKWWPSLGRGGRVGLYKKVSDEPEWYVVVCAGCDDATLEKFERALEEFQGSPGKTVASMGGSASFLDALPLFSKMEALADRNRERIALLFADAAGFDVQGHGKLKDRGAGEPCDSELFAGFSRSGGGAAAAAAEETRLAARRWLFEIAPDSAEPGSAARLPPGFTKKIGWGYRFPARAPSETETAFDSSFAGADAAKILDESEIERRNEYATSRVSCAWNVLRRGESRDEVVWYSDCAPQGSLVEYGDPAAHVFVYRWSAGAAGAGSATLPFETMGAFPVVVPPAAAGGDREKIVQDEDAARHFSSDSMIKKNAQLFASYASRETRQTEAEIFGSEFTPSGRTVLEPMLVREANRAYDGTVFLCGGSAAAPAAAADARRLLERRCGIVDFEYEPPS